MIRREAALVATALTFLTRLPLVARWSSADPAALNASLRYFPLCGALVGALLALVYSSALSLWPPPIAALLTLSAGLALTGAFHEDGLADTADGLGGSFERARKLEIMRDSRIGSYGAAALIVLLLGKWSALAELDSTVAIGALITAHTLARASSLLLISALPYARDEGRNKPIAAGIGRGSLLIGIASAGLLTLVSSPLPTALVALFVLTAVCILSGGLYRQQLGGLTGDTLGATNQLVELGVLLVFVALEHSS
jgi:adenosylcobinamide-GDP ribazoletransferase